MAHSFALTRIVNSCVLLEFGRDAILTDPWFREYWYLRFGERLGMHVSDLPRLTAILGTHELPNHWDPRSLASYPYASETPVFVATSKMAKQARRAGFQRVEVLAWGETRKISPDLTLECLPAQRVSGVTANNYVLSSKDLRIFFGGEARDLAPLRAYRESHPPVDLVLAPTNGLRLLGRQLVMGPRELLEAAQILGAEVIIPIHDALDPRLRFLPGFVFRRGGSAEETSRLAAKMPGGRPRVCCLETGVRWRFSADSV